MCTALRKQVSKHTPSLHGLAQAVSTHPHCTALPHYPATIYMPFHLVKSRSARHIMTSALPASPQPSVAEQDRMPPPSSCCNCRCAETGTEALTFDCSIRLPPPSEGKAFEGIGVAVSSSIIMSSVPLGLGLQQQARAEVSRSSVGQHVTRQIKVQEAFRDNGTWGLWTPSQPSSWPTFRSACPHPPHKLQSLSSQPWFQQVAN